MNLEFGQPDTIYEGPASLIVAAHVFPLAFSSETHKFVADLIAIEITVTQPDTDS